MRDVLGQLDKILAARKLEKPESSYVSSLYASGIEKILKKVAEESAETIMAAKDCQQQPNSQKAKEHLVYEITDLWFHTLVLLSQQGLSSKNITEELQKRFGLSGLEEKASRQGRQAQKQGQKHE